jgi:predicted Zn-dependent protease
MERNSYIEFCTRFYEGLYRHRRNDLSVIQILSNLYAMQGDQKNSFRMDRRHVQLEPLNPIAHYNLACDLSLQGKENEAVKSLEIAVALGYDDLQWIADDIDLDPIRKNKKFKALLANHFLKISSK